MKTALIAGATGLIGKQVLTLLLKDDQYARVLSIARKDLGIVHPKLIELKFELNKIPDYADQLAVDDVYCCLGTTMAKARSREKFYEVDYVFPLSLATVTISRGAKQFLLVSALGADKKSSIYYNRVKGEIEQAITEIGFEALHIFRPSLLLGDRAESRPGEDAAKIVYKAFGFLIPEKYKGIDAAKVARAMLRFASKNLKGIFVHESKEMQHMP